MDNSSSERISDKLDSLAENKTQKQEHIMLDCFCNYNNTKWLVASDDIEREITELISNTFAMKIIIYTKSGRRVKAWVCPEMGGLQLFDEK